jgi:hypothetical protein
MRQEANVYGETVEVLTCHTTGKFFKFASTTTIAMIRDVLPGPVRAFCKRAFTLTLEAPMPTPTAATVASVLIESFVAPAMVAIRKKLPMNFRRNIRRMKVHKGTKRTAQISSVLHMPM